MIAVEILLSEKIRLLVEGGSQYDISDVLLRLFLRQHILKPYLYETF